MPSMTANVLYDNFERSVVSFVWGGGSSVVAGGLTGSINASSLTGYNASNGLSGSNVNINVTKAFWSLAPGTTASAMEIAWGVSGSLTGNPFLYLNGSGYVNFSAEAFAFANGSTADTRRNYVQVRNSTAMQAGETVTLILELDKNGGFTRLM
jgi:hypothetical protein